MTSSVSAYTVTIAGTGQGFACAPGESVLRALARTGRRGIPVGCRGGGCGVCKIQVLSGGYRTAVMSRAHVSAEDERAGQALACCVFPLADLRVWVIGKLQRRMA